MYTYSLYFLINKLSSELPGKCEINQPQKTLPSSGFWICLCIVLSFCCFFFCICFLILLVYVLGFFFSVCCLLRVNSFVTKRKSRNCRRGDNDGSALSTEPWPAGKDTPSFSASIARRQNLMATIRQAKLGFQIQRKKQLDIHICILDVAMPNKLDWNRFMSQL